MFYRNRTKKCVLFFSDGYEERSRVKRPRAPPPPDQDINLEPEQELDERNGPPKGNYVPPGFLSPSVQEYLELGKSIPGIRYEIIYRFNFDK